MKKSNKQKEVIIMAESHVQLKREEVVGDEVVLTDISPSTNTESVVDLSTGLTLDEDLLRLWNAINNKLYRVVNSVNGRTGVVVLSAKDVGLDNVDNVSFADIQEWVLEQIEKLFGSHSFKLYESMDSVLIDISANDKMMSGTGFFASEGFSAENDKLAYIGYFYWDEGNKHLSYDMRPVNIIGETDSSIIYNEKIGEKDYRGGKLGINIWPYEDALEVYEGLSNVPGEPKANSGLRIIKSKLVPDVLLIDGVYGSDFERPGDSEDAWLYAVPPSDITDVVRVDIIYDGKKLTNPDMAYAKKVFKYHDIIVCHFASDYTDADDNLLEGVNKDLIGLHTAIGTVTAIDKKADETVVSYTVEFFSTKQHIGYGLRYRSTHTNELNNKALNRLEINTPLGVVSTIYSGWEEMNEFANMSGIYADDVSGLTIRANDHQRYAQDYEKVSHVQPLQHQYVNLPNGPTRVFHPTFDGSGYTNYAGLSITTDSSLSIIPAYSFLRSDPKINKYDGSMVAFNWRADADFFDASSLDSPDNYGENSPGSLIGINLDKLVVNKHVFDVAGYIFGNLSGLRINPARDNVDFDVIGITDTTNVPEAYTTSGTSGGLAINVGKFMKIEPTELSDTNDSYYDGGKLTIKVGPGLGDDGNGNLSLYADPKSCFEIVYPEEGESYLDIKFASTSIPAGNEEGLTTIEINNSGLRGFYYNPEGEKKYGLGISLSKDSGLIIKNEPDPTYTGAETPENVSTIGVNYGDGLCVDKNGKLVPKVAGSLIEGAKETSWGLYVDPVGRLAVKLDLETTGLDINDDGEIVGDYQTIKYSGNLKVAKTYSDGSVRYGYTDPFSIEYNPGTSAKNIVIGNGLRLVLDETEVPQGVTVSWPYEATPNPEEGEQP